MYLSYDGIVFDLVLLENWTREAVYDASGTDFLYWHHVLDVVVTVGGDANNPQRFPPVSARMGKPERAIKRDGPVPFPLVAPNALKRFGEHGLERKGGDLDDIVRALPIFEDVNNPNQFRNKESPTPNTVPWTDHELRKRLSTPRRQLLVWLYTRQIDDKRIFGKPPLLAAIEGADRVIRAQQEAGEAEFLLTSPLTGIGTDARHGPLCTILDLPTIHGNATGIYRLRFETWEAPVDYYKLTLNNEEEGVIKAEDRHILTLADVRNKNLAQRRVAQMPPILSNRWTMHQMPDPHSYLNTVTIEGQVYFRMDVLKERQLTADQLRQFFMHPLAIGYERHPPEVSLSEGGDVVRYKVTDQEVMTNFHAARRWGLISIDIQQSHVFHPGSIAGYAGGGAQVDHTFMDGKRG